MKSTSVMSLLKVNFFALMMVLSYSTQAQAWVSYQSQQQINDLVDMGTELWMATDAGLVVVNKATLEKTIFNTANSNLSNNHIQTITKGQNDVVWIGTYDVVLALFDGSEFHNTITPQHNAYNPQTTKLYDIEVAPNGDLWLGTSDGVFHRQGQTWMHYDEAEFGASFFEAWDVAINDIGEVFVASFNIYQLANGVWSNLTENTNIHPYLGAKLYFSQAGDLYLAGDLDVIALFDGADWHSYPHGLNGSHIKGFTEDTNGDIYFYAQIDGVYKLTNDVWTAEIDEQTSALDNYAAYFYIDEDNKRWLNNNIHLSVNNNGDIQTILISQHTLASNSTYNLSKGANGAMYFITSSDNNIAVADADGTWSSLPLPAAAPPFERFNDILALADNDIWLASNSGLYHFNGSGWAFMSLNACRSLAVDTQGKIYARASDRLYIVANGTISEFNVSNSPLSTALITGHGVDAADNLWIAESDLWEPNGQTFIHKVSSAGVWTTYSNTEYPVINKVNGDFHFDGNGNVWIPAYPYGTVKFDGTNFSNPFIGNLALFDNYNAFSIESDANGKVYFSHQYGVTTLFNDEWEDLLIEDVPNENSSFEAKINFDNAGNLWWASSRYGVFAYPTGITSTTRSDFEPNTNFSIYPNPAQFEATLDFTLPRAAKVKALLYNSFGQVMTDLDLGQVPAGSFKERMLVTEFPKGLYFLQLHIDGQTSTRTISIQ